MNNTNKKTEISISSYGVKATCEIPCDSTIDDIMSAFKGMLVSISYPPFLFDSWVVEQAEEIKQEKDDGTNNT